jgi:hypothetical protein
VNFSRVGATLPFVVFVVVLLVKPWGLMV